MLHPEMGRTGSWTRSPRVMPLASAAVQIWRVRVRLELSPGAALDAAVDAAIAATVTPGEHERAARFRFEPDRQRYLHGRMLTRLLLGHHLGLEPAAVTFITGDHGKPFLDPASSASRLFFNAAHSGDWVLVALARGRDLGVDVEAHRTMSDVIDIARRFFAPPELEALEAWPEEAREAAFFRIWTRKEAVVKALGTGISAGLDAFAVDAGAVDAGAAASGARVAMRGLDGSPEWARWAVHTLDMPPGYAAAVTIESSPRQTKEMRAPSEEDARIELFEWTWETAATPPTHPRQAQPSPAR
jgi:4'-phosphopantetheinyl transferase